MPLHSHIKCASKGMGYEEWLANSECILYTVVEELVSRFEKDVCATSIEIEKIRLMEKIVFKHIYNHSSC